MAKKDEEPAEEEAVEFATDVSDSEDKEEPVPGPSGRQSVTRMTGNEDENTRALPPQMERGYCFAEKFTRYSGRERRTPGKFLDFNVCLARKTAGEYFTDRTVIADETGIAYALIAGTIKEKLLSAIEGFKQRSYWDTLAAQLAADSLDLNNCCRMMDDARIVRLCGGVEMATANQQLP